MGDWRGGVVISVGYGVAAGLILWDQGIFGPDELFGKQLRDPVIPKIGGLPSFGIMGTVGLGLATATTVFGILRPIFYHKTGSKSRVAQALSGAQIAIIPAASPHGPEIKAVRLSYSFQF
jgi:hypothetical protein